MLQKLFLFILHLLVRQYLHITSENFCGIWLSFYQLLLGRDNINIERDSFILALSTSDLLAIFNKICGLCAFILQFDNCIFKECF